MNRLITNLCILLVLVSCGGNSYSQNKGSVKLFEDVQEEVIDALWDKTTTSERLTDVMIQYGEYLKIAAANPDNVNIRVDAQRRALLTMTLLLEKFAQMDSLGIEVTHAQMDSCLSRLVDISGQWYYAEHESGRMICKEVYYNSYQQSENPVPGYFRIAVLLSTEEHLPFVTIFYPQTAESDPLIIFTKEEVDGVPVGGWGNQDFVYPHILEMKNAKGDGAPMNDSFGPDFIEKMLSNEHMYLVFNSESPAPGVPGDREIARVGLSYFQDKYNEATK